MKFIDLFGLPGSGKSTLADPIWHPHAVPVNHNDPIPMEWAPFTDEITRLFGLIRDHPTFGAALRMNRRSIRKMMTVYREKIADNTVIKAKGRTLPAVYVQTGFIQRGLGFGWRLNQMGKDLNELRPFFQLVPVSIGVGLMCCPANIVEARNHARKNVPETAHEDRAFMVPLMQPAIEIAIEELRKRNVEIFKADTTQPIDFTQRQLLDFVEKVAYDADAFRYSGHSVFPPPPWFS